MNIAKTFKLITQSCLFLEIFEKELYLMILGQHCRTTFRKRFATNVATDFSLSPHSS
jgi:hypothetical protein